MTSTVLDVGKYRASKPKKLNGHRYKQLLKSLGKRVTGSDLSIEKKSHLSQSEVNVTEPNDPNKDEKANADNSISHSQRERLDFVLRRVKAAGHGKRNNSSNHSTQTKRKKNHKSETVHNMDKSKLKKQFERCGAYMCKFTKPNFVEYWVPVGLSEMQTEQYCGTLFSNADILCSCSKHDPTEFLNDILVSILVSTKKCCDHPYLVDGSMCASLIRDVPKPELLDAEIRLSNKFLLLHKILLEIRKRGLRVLILYQSFGGSGLFSIGDILDEIIHQKFGTDLYVRIGGRRRISRSKRRAALNTFNDKENGKFICLMETDSCIPSVKLASIDTVIFFNSDWNPLNDLKALQKIDLDSQFEHVKVFRLYSSYTLEEKLLILAKQGMALEGNVSDIKQSTCHQLLTWGASYLFEKLDEFHNRNSNISDEDSSEDVLLELSNLLPNNEKSSVCENKNSIVEVQQIEGIYLRNVSLPGEVEEKLLMDNISFVEHMILKEPHVFWMKLLEGRNPRWKYFSSQSRRSKKIIQHFDDLPEASAEVGRAFKKCRKEARSAVYQIPANIRRRIRSKLQNRDKKRKLSGGEKCDPVSNKVKHDSLPSSRTTQNDHSHGTSSSTFQTQDATHPLVEDSVRQLESFVPQQAIHIASPTRKDRREPSATNEARVSLTSLNSQPPEESHVKIQYVCKTLQVELEGLRKQKTELLKLHEEKKLQMEMACEKEIDQIRKKYDMLLQSAETALLEEKEVLEAKYNKVYINKSLAEAVMERDSAENLTLPQVTANCSIQEMYQLFFQWAGSNTATRPGQVAKSPPIPSLLGCSVPEWGPIQESPSERIASRSNQYCENSFPTLQNPVTSSDVATYLPIGQSFNITKPNPPLTPLVQVPRKLVGVPVRPLVSPMAIIPFNFSGNVPADYRVRAPAPHFNHMMPLQPITAPKMPSPGVVTFSPVSLRPVTSNVQTLQSAGPNLWALSAIAGLPF